MCLHPITLRKESIYFRWNDKEHHFVRSIPYVTGSDFSLDMATRPYKFSNMVVPCCKCMECLRARQDDIAARCAIEADKRGSMHLITLTYRDEDLPFSYVVRMVDKLTGEVYTDSKYKVFDRKWIAWLKTTKKRRDENSMRLISEVRDGLLRQTKGSKARYYSVPYSGDVMESLHAYVRESEVESDYEDIFADECERIPDLPFFDDGFYYYIDFTLSLNRRDVRLWLKNARVKYQRMTGNKLPEFSYIVCGEMGPKTCRPHYHIALLGLNDMQAAFVAGQWQYGFHKLDRVNRVSKKNGRVGSGFVAAGKYIAKYISKGVFEADSVLAGDAEKGRLMCSIDFGITGVRRIEKVHLPNGKSYERERWDLSESTINYYRGYDVFGKYDLNDFRKSYDDVPMTIDDVQRLHELLMIRRTYSVDGQKYRVPKIMLNRLWYEKENLTKKSCPTLVRRALQSFIATDFAEDFISEYCKCYPDATRTDAYSAYLAQSKNDSIVREIKKASIEKTFRQFYGQSKF